MAPKSKKQLENQKVEKRKLIMDAALEVFASYGFHGASISLIANKAGIAKGLIYTYFPSKDDILKSILKKGMADLIEIFQPAIQQELSPELFKSLIQQYFELLGNNTSFWRLYFSIALQPHVLEIVTEELEPVAGQYMFLLSDYYKRQGSKNPEADAMMTHSLLDGITLNVIMSHHDINIKKVENLAIEQVLKAKY